MVKVSGLRSTLSPAVRLAAATLLYSASLNCGKGQGMCDLNKISYLDKQSTNITNFCDVVVFVLW